jgi:hypothetical protein
MMEEEHGMKKGTVNNDNKEFYKKFGTFINHSEQQLD